jgi:Tfp pilus assembly protein PilO
MRRDFTSRKRIILSALAILLLADIALAGYSWNIGSASRRQQDLAVLGRNRDLLKSDVKRAQDIRQNIPGTQKDCDRFEHMLFPQSSGYSSVTAELGEMAAKSGLQLEGKTFHEAEVKGRGLTEVFIEVTVDGNYSNVVRFLNGMQRSENVYAIDSLALNSDQSPGSRGLVKVTVHMKTYFRAV